MSTCPRQARPIYVYSDETGQQTKGKWLLVAALAIRENRREVERNLERVEKETGKRTDWAGSSARILERYLTAALQIDTLSNCVYFKVYEDIPAENYHQYAIDAMLHVARACEPVRNPVFVPEGFTYDTRERLRVKARETFPGADVWTGSYRKRPIVRLADALAGMIAQRRFNPGTTKDFPHLMLESFVELTNETPAHSATECRGQASTALQRRRRPS